MRCILLVLVTSLLYGVDYGVSQLSSNVSNWLKNVDWSTTPTAPDCTIKGKPAVCTSLFTCKNPQQADSTSDLFDYRILGCAGDYDVCCLPEDVENEKSSSSTSTSTSTSTSSSTSTTTTSTTTTTTQKPRSIGCGASRPGGYRDAIIPEYSEYAEYPWVVALVKVGEVVGAGSIIHPSVVITASRKLEQTTADQWTCRAGEWDLDQSKLLNSRQNRDVKKIVMHSDKNLRIVGTSAALLFLKSPFEISAETPHVGIACLDKNKPKVGANCETMGWGTNVFGAKDYSRRLKKKILPIVSHDQCTVMLRQTRLGPSFNLHDSFTCAGGRAGEDACTGDGGAPLVCPISDDGMRYAVYGMVAWGIGCGNANVPGVYIDVPHYYEWIALQMIDEGFDTSSYNFN